MYAAGNVAIPVGLPIFRSFRTRDSRFSGPFYEPLNGSFSDGSIVDIQLFEADGVTPVTILDADLTSTPEPATVGFGLLGGFFLLAFRKRGLALQS